MPSPPTGNARGQVEVNDPSDTTTTQTVTGDFAHMNVDAWNALEVSTMSNLDPLWPSGGGGRVPTSTDNWSALCGEVEFSTMPNLDPMRLSGGGGPVQTSTDS